jgi:hypothetical protein
VLPKVFFADSPCLRVLISKHEIVYKNFIFPVKLSCTSRLFLRFSCIDLDVQISPLSHVLAVFRIRFDGLIDLVDPVP